MTDFDYTISEIYETACDEIESMARKFRFNTNYAYEIGVFSLFVVCSAISDKDKKLETAQKLFASITEKYSHVGYAATQDRLKLYGKVFNGTVPAEGVFIEHKKTSKTGKIENISITLGDIILDPLCVSVYGSGEFSPKKTGDSAALEGLFRYDIPEAVSRIVKTVREAENPGSTVDAQAVKKNPRTPELPTLITVAGICALIASFLTALGVDMMRFSPLIAFLALAVLAVLEFRVKKLLPHPKKKPRKIRHKALTVITIIAYIAFAAFFVVSIALSTPQYLSSDYRDMCLLARQLKPVHYVICTFLHYAAMAASVIQVYVMVRIVRLAFFYRKYPTLRCAKETSRKILAAHILRIASGILMIINYVLFFGILGMSSLSVPDIIIEVANMLFTTVCGIILFKKWSDASISRKKKKEAQVSEPAPETPEPEYSENEPEMPDSSAFSQFREDVADRIETLDDEPEEDVSGKIEEEQIRYLELMNELKDYPADKIRKWHAEGKLSDVEYKSAVKKYNSIRAEMKEISDRVRVLRGE